jgi:hypothetical protein
LPEPDKTVREKLYIDLRWAMSVADYQAIPGFSKPPAAFFAEAEQQHAQQSGKKARNNGKNWMVITTHKW